MAKGIAVLILAFGITWSTLLLPWVDIDSQTLTGAELSQVLVSLPGVAILMALIALYRKFPRVLILASGSVMLFSTFLAVSTNFSFAPASLQLQESITGLAGESTLGSQTFWPLIFAVLSGLSGLLSLWVATLPVSSKVRVDEPGVNDARSIWDEQV